MIRGRSHPALGVRMRLEAIAASALFCLATAPAIAEEPPAALVMAVSGTTTPPMSEMSEIPSGQTVQIATDAQLTVLDYTRCKMITVSGGTLSVTRFDFTTDGKIVAQADAPVPAHPPAERKRRRRRRRWPRRPGS